MIPGERGGNALTPRFWPENRRRRASGGDVGPKVVRFPTQVRRGFLQRAVSPPRFGGDRPPVTLAPGEAHPFPRRNEDASKLKDLRGWIRLVITRTQDNKLAGKAMKTISVSVDDETHRLARIRAAQTGTTVSAMMRGLPLGLRCPAGVEGRTRRRGLRTHPALGRHDHGVGGGPSPGAAARGGHALRLRGGAGAGGPGPATGP